MKNLKRKLLIFSDPGLDDALALIWLLKQNIADIIGLVPVAGNHNVNQVTRNMKEILINSNRFDIPIYHTKNIEQKFHELPNIHGKDALGDFIPNKEHNNLVVKDFKYIYNDLTNIDYEIISIAPCTVLAEFLKNTVVKPSKMTIMGGFENEIANFNGSEFNLGMDIPASDYVINYPHCSIDIITLDVTRQYYLTKKIINKLDESNNECSFFKNACKVYMDLADKRGTKKAYPHDLTAIISVFFRDVFLWELGILNLKESKIILANGNKDNLAKKIKIDPDKFESIILGGINAI